LFQKFSLERNYLLEGVDGHYEFIYNIFNYYFNNIINYYN